jgi:hypothetical protein
MMNLNLYFGKVEDNDDSNKKGRLQVRLIPEMQGVQTADLPWLVPFLGGSVDGGSFQTAPLEVGSTVWCYFQDETFQHGWYISGVFFDQKVDFTNTETDLSNITDASVGNYKDLRLTRYTDGTIHFHNVNTGVTGIYHNTGSYVIFDGNGGIIGYAKDKIKLYNDTNSIELGTSGGITIDPGTGTVDIGGSAKSLVTYADLVQILTFLFANLDSRIHIDPLSGMTGTVNPTHINLTFNPNYETQKANMEATKVKTS